MGLREVTRSFERSRNGDIGEAVGHQLILPLNAYEEEKLLFFLIELARNVSGASHIESSEVVTIKRPGTPINVVSPGVGIEILMTMEGIAGAVEVLRTRLGNDLDLGSGTSC